MSKGVFEDLTGQKFGMLTVIARGENRGKSVAWVCKCDCGRVKEISVNAWSLKSGKTRSCGCLYKGGKPGRIITHGKTHTTLYHRYSCMIDRCYNKNHTAYHNYGGRGIKICDEWKNDFMTFYSWALANGYSDDLTLDRIDVNGDYEPNNCRFISMREQSRNRRDTVKITINGIEKSVSEWSEISGVNRYTIIWRYRHGWPESNLLLPARKEGKKK